MILGLELRSKRLEQSSIVPSRHSVVRSLHAMYKSLNSVAVVVQQEAKSVSFDIFSTWDFRLLTQ